MLNNVPVCQTFNLLTKYCAVCLQALILFFLCLCMIYVVLTSLDNYLAMEVACTMVCPKANKEVIIVEPDGKETQKCEKCEGECPKGVCICFYMMFKLQLKNV